MKNILLENMLRFGTKNLSEAAIRRRLLSEQVDAAAYGVPGNTATTDEDFVKWYESYLSPSTGYVGQTLLIMKGDSASEAKDSANNLFASKGGIVANIIGRCVVGSLMNFGYRSARASDSSPLTGYNGMAIWDAAITRNYDWSKQTMILKTAEQYASEFPGLYDTDLADAGLSLVQEGTYTIPGTSASIPIVVGDTKVESATPGGKNFMTSDPIVVKRPMDWSFSPAEGNGATVWNSRLNLRGYCPWVDQRLVPINYNGYGTTAAAGTEVPMQTGAFMEAWVTKNVKKGKYIGPAGN